MGFGKTNVAAGGGDEEKLKAHLNDKDNPHEVTAEQVGLGNVPNVATDDQTPTFSVAGTLAALVSGEKLSVSMGKIAKAVSDLIAHLADTTKHITAAERTSWNGKAAGSHTHQASDITGVLPVSRGGTGKSSWSSNRLLYAASASTFSQLAFPSMAGAVLSQGTSGAAYWRSDIVTLLDLLKSLTSTAGESIDITWTFTAAVAGGKAVASGGNVIMNTKGDYAEFTATMPNKSASIFLFYLESISPNTGGGGSYPADRFTLYVNNVAYDLGLSPSTGYYNNLPEVQLAEILGKLPTTAVIKLRETCVTAPGGGSLFLGSVGRTFTSKGRIYAKGGMT